jgi:hypothetical protein
VIVAVHPKFQKSSAGLSTCVVWIMFCETFGCVVQTCVHVNHLTQPLSCSIFLSVGQMYAQTPLGAHWQSMGRPMKNAWTNGVDGYKILIVQIAGLTEVEVQQRKSPELS